MKMYTAEIAHSYPAMLGEGALWDVRNERLWWVDITKGQLHRFDPVTGINDTFTIGTKVGTVVPEYGGDVLLAIQHGFARFNTKTEELMLLKTITHKNESIRLNDGKCDPFGRFWAGTLAEDGSSELGILYCLDRDFSVTEKISSVGISNGIGWSPRGDAMYYIDSMSQKVVSYVYDGKTGMITDPRTVAVFDLNEGTPDGLCVDAEGMLWVALWGGGKVVRLDPADGSRLSEVIVPGVQKVTSCALGGKDLRTLFITTARQGLTKEEEIRQQHAGSLFAVAVDVPGIPAYSFRGMA